MRVPGQIITFYSYKGGVGRTMALANMAWLLASNNKRVLAIDWDLEAPGLTRYFQPFLPDDLSFSPGLLEFLNSHGESALQTQAAVPSILRGIAGATGVELSDYALPLKWKFRGGGTLDIIAAGKQGSQYAQDVTNFNWPAFYSQYGGHQTLEHSKHVLKAIYDYILIDSRTGMNDASGVCTIQMPDAVVIFLALNRQNLDGASYVADSITRQDQRSSDEARVRIFPVIARVERSEKERLNSTRLAIADRFSKHLRHIPSADQTAYWSAMEIPYLPAYAYEETLCTFADDSKSTSPMANCIEQITEWITGEALSYPRLSRLEQQRVLAAFLRPEPFSTSRRSCVISYSSKDEEFAKKLLAGLKEAGIQCWFAPHNLPIGGKLRVEIDEAIANHDLVIVILSVNSIASVWVEKEIETAFEKEASTGTTVLLPIRVDSSVLNANAAWAADIRRQRHIGDFTLWRDEAVYEEALSRLIHSITSNKTAAF